MDREEKVAAQNSEVKTSRRTSFPLRRRSALRLATLVIAVAVGASAVTGGTLLWLRGHGSLPAEQPSAASTAASGVSVSTTATYTTAQTVESDASTAFTTESAVPTTPSASLTAAVTTPSSTTAVTGTVGTAAPVTTVPSATVSTTAATVPFTPDYRDGYANTSTRNYLARAAAELDESLVLDWQDEWVYQSDGYKFRRDGSGERIRFCTATYLYGMSVIGDWVYYIENRDLKRVRTDGAVTETLVAFGNRFKEVRGFFVEDGVLYYSVYEQDAFLAMLSWVDCIDLKSGEQRRNSNHTNLRLNTAVPLMGGWVTLDDVQCIYYPKTADYYVELDSVFTLNRFPMGDGGIFFASIAKLGNTLYDSTAVFNDYWVRGGGSLFDKEKYPTVFDRPFTVIEFADEETGRLAVSFLSSDGRPLDMRWYTPGTDSYGEQLPAHMWRTGDCQRYLVDGQGRVYLAQQKNGKCTTVFSAKMDGSDYVRYTYAQ